MRLSLKDPTATHPVPAAALPGTPLRRGTTAPTELSLRAVPGAALQLAVWRWAAGSVLQVLVIASLQVQGMAPTGLSLAVWSSLSTLRRTASLLIIVLAGHRRPLSDRKAALSSNGSSALKDIASHHHGPALASTHVGRIDISTLISHCRLMPVTVRLGKLCKDISMY